MSYPAAVPFRRYAKGGIVPLVQIKLDEETYARLNAAADVERRPLSWQARLLVERALRVPPQDPLPPVEQADVPAE
jgi:hypothetical protein